MDCHTHFRKPNYSPVFLDIMKRELKLIPYETAFEEGTFILRTKIFDLHHVDEYDEIWYELFSKEPGKVCLVFNMRSFNELWNKEVLWENPHIGEPTCFYTKEEAIERCFPHMLDHFYNFIHAA